MVVNERPSKRMKRRVSADLYNFLTFPAAGDGFFDESAAGEPFRKAVQRFLTNHARLTFPPSLFPSLMTWQILFRIGGLLDGPDLSPAMVTLDIVEEDVTRSRSSVYCDQCRVVGESTRRVITSEFVERHTLLFVEEESGNICQSRCLTLLVITFSRDLYLLHIETKHEYENEIPS